MVVAEETLYLSHGSVVQCGQEPASEQRSAVRAHHAGAQEVHDQPHLQQHAHQTQLRRTLLPKQVLLNNAHHKYPMHTKNSGHHWHRIKHAIEQLTYTPK